jgi:hypothetical protein
VFRAPDCALRLNSNAIAGDAIGCIRPPLLIQEAHRSARDKETAMKRLMPPLSLVFLLALAAPAHAAAPTTDAKAFGIELCAQSMCGSAIFAGILSGEVAGVATPLGTFAVSVTHDDLPTILGQQSAITGGSVELRTGTRTVRGIVVGGTLTYLGNNEFLVQMVIATRSAGTLAFQGVLSHNTFPPTIAGHIVSIP